MSNTAWIDRLRCIALDINGKRCRERKTKPVKYHGEAELYHEPYDGQTNNPPTWVLARLCAKHRKPND